VGAVHLRDLVAGSARAPAPAVAELVRPVDSVPETKDLGAILRELRSSRRELAMVVDEYGRVSGLVTVEDILEEIVGEIEDEFDLPDAKVVDLGNGAFEVSGSVTVDDLNEELGLALPTDGPRTVAGIVFDAVGRLPEVGDRVEVEGVELAVELMAGQKIVRIALSPPTSG
jgi:putative hemolysin